MILTLLSHCMSFSRFCFSLLHGSLTRLAAQKAALTLILSFSFLRKQYTGFTCISGASAADLQPASRHARAAAGSAKGGSRAAAAAAAGSGNGWRRWFG
jgi:hypothetical protein